MPSVARVAALVLAVTFAWAASAKAVGWSRWRTALAGYSLPPGVERIARVATPVAEAVTAVLLVTDGVLVGAALTVALVAAFCIAIARARSFQGERLPCGCFGGREEISVGALLARNALLAVLAGLVLVTGNEVGSPLADLRASQAVPATLIALGLAAGAWMVWQASTALKRRDS